MTIIIDLTNKSDFLFSAIQMLKRLKRGTLAKDTDAEWAEILIEIDLARTAIL